MPSLCAHRPCVRLPLLIGIPVRLNLDPQTWPCFNLITSVKSLFPQTVMSCTVRGDFNMTSSTQTYQFNLQRSFHPCCSHREGRGLCRRCRRSGMWEYSFIDEQGFHGNRENLSLSRDSTLLGLTCRRDSRTGRLTSLTSPALVHGLWPRRKAGFKDGESC